MPVSPAIERGNCQLSVLTGLPSANHCPRRHGTHGKPTGLSSTWGK
jgi:hypothetical protein